MLRKSDILVMDGEAHTIEEWLAIRNLSMGGFRHRLSKGMTIEEALNAPHQYICPPKKPRADRNCVNCKYSMQVMLIDGGIWHACDYMGQMGHRRPCESGDLCTVKVRRGKNNA